MDMGLCHMTNLRSVYVKMDCNDLYERPSSDDRGELSFASVPIIEIACVTGVTSESWRRSLR